MGSCVSKKAARAAATRGGKLAAPLPVVEKEKALPPVVEEEVKEVVLSETPAPRPPRPPPAPVKRTQEKPEDEEASSEECSAGESASVASIATAKAGGEKEVEKRAVHAPGRARRAPPEEDKPKGGAGNGRARSPSPSSAHRRLLGGQQQPPAPRSRREQPAVVSGFGCRSGRFSPFTARRAAESAVRRSHSAREADMALPSKRSLAASININGHGNAAGYGGGSGLTRRDPGERSERRSDSPTAKRPSAYSSPIHRPASPMRKAAKEQSTPERARPRNRDGLDTGRGGDELPGLGGAGGERKKMAVGEEGALGQNPSVAMECFIFL